MIFDAVSVARRGVGAEELRLASPAFLDAVRWAAYAERMWDGVEEQKALAASTPHGLSGAAMTEFLGERTKARAFVKQRRELLLLAEATDG